MGVVSITYSNSLIIRQIGIDYLLAHYNQLISEIQIMIKNFLQSHEVVDPLTWNGIFCKAPASLLVCYIGLNDLEINL